MMRITSIARESRGVETKHGANLSGAQSGNQAIEAGSFDGTTELSPNLGAGRSQAATA